MPLRAHNSALVAAVFLCFAPRAAAQARRELLAHTAPAAASALRRPLWRGLSAPDATLLLSLDGRHLGRVTADQHGHWNFITPSPIPRGAHTAGVWVDGTDPLRGDAHAFTVSACEADDECGGLTPRCDLTLQSCRACESDDDCGERRPRCVSAGPAAGMCAPLSPALLEPTAGSALGPGGAVRGDAAPGELIALLVDGREVSRGTADARGEVRIVVSASLRGWHTISMASVQEGIVLPAAEGSRVLAVECTSDADCASGASCDARRFTCADQPFLRTNSRMNSARVAASSGDTAL